MIPDSIVDWAHWNWVWLPLKRELNKYLIKAWYKIKRDLSCYIFILLMKIPIFITLLALSSFVGFGLDLSQYRRHIHNENFKPYVTEPLPQTPLEDLPTNFFWGDVNGKNFLTFQRNQHIPQYCGSCWAFAATSALSDRIKIQRNAQWPDVNIAPQVLISCEEPDQGCHGGDARTAYEWISKNNITD